MASKRAWKPGSRFRDVEQPHVFGKKVVDGLADGAGRLRFRQIEVDDLAVRMDARVCAAGSLDAHRGACDMPERVVENRLDGARGVFLNLPAVKAGADVGHGGPVAAAGAHARAPRARSPRTRRAANGTYSRAYTIGGDSPGTG